MSFKAPVCVALKLVSAVPPPMVSPKLTCPPPTLKLKVCAPFTVEPRVMLLFVVLKARLLSKLIALL